MRGVVAAGHPVTAEAGAEALRAGGNAVDAALAAMFASFVAEPMLTGLGAGGYMLVAPPGEAARPARLLRRGAGPRARAAARRTRRCAPSTSTSATRSRSFNIGAAAAGPYGTVAGACDGGRALRRGCRWPSWSRPPRRSRAAGSTVNAQQAYLFEILHPITEATPEARALYMPAGRPPVVGEVHRDPALADALERLGGRGPGAVLHRRRGGGGVRVGSPTAAGCSRAPTSPRTPRSRARPCASPTAARRSSRTRRRAPAASCSRYALALLERGPAPPSVAAIVDAMEAAQAERTPEFLAGLPGARVPRALHARAGWARTTHISAADVRRLGVRGHVHERRGLRRGRARHRHPPEQHDGRAGPLAVRLPRPSAGPAAAVDDGADDGARADGGPRLVLGSAGSNRIRSVILQVVIGVLDHGLDVQAAIDAPRVHLEDGDRVRRARAWTPAGLESDQRALVRFSARNLFFGGAQAVQRDPGTGSLSGGGDPRRGGAVAVA